MPLNAHQKMMSSPWSSVPRVGAAGRVASALAALLLVILGPGLAVAQEATTDKPGVIDDSGDGDSGGESDGESGAQNGQQQGAAEDENQQQQQQQNQNNDQNQGQQPPDQQGQVITPDNANPNEQYNLPPNFDPNHRPEKTPENVKVTIDFRQANLEEVVKFFSGMMNKNFIIADSIQANKTITIISPEDVTLGEAYRAFLAALEMNGLTLVQMGGFSKIVQAQNAISEPSRTYDEDDRIPNEARMVTAIIPIKNADTERIREVIGNFTSQHATVITHDNSLILSENAANVRRIRQLVERLDKGDTGEQVFVYKIRYAEAKKVSEKLREIFQQEDGQGGGNRRRNKNDDSDQQEGNGQNFNVDVSQLIADERTNQLIIATSQRSFEKVKEMIKLLDVPTEAGGGQVHVKFLEYASAEELASTLSSLVSSNQQNNQQQRRRRARARNNENNEDGGNEQTVAALLQGDVQITAYKPNNALIVTAAPKDYVALEQVIDTLDKPRKQVYVEAVIMEVSLDTDRTLGLGVNTGIGKDFQGLIPDSAVESGAVDDTNGLIVGQSNFPGLQGLTNAISGTGGAIGLLGPLVQIPGTQISLPAFALLLQATQTDNSVNILSTPSILTLDNKEAEIMVGEQVPIQRGISGGGGGLGGLGSLAAGSALGQSQNQRGRNNRQNQQGGLGGLGGLAGGLGGGLGGLGGGLISPIDYKDVGLTLRIKPQVNDSRYVRLEVDQEVSDIKGAGGSNLTPTTTRRNAKTTVLVKDQSTVVIGGLMRDVENKTTEKVPFLGDIPLVGVLFRKTSTITTKQNLVLMLTPYIIESESDLQKIYRRKIKERRELLKLFGKQDSGYDKVTNFRKKSGLVDRMHEKISEAVQKQKAREKARESFQENGPRYQILGGDQSSDASQQTDGDGSSQSDGGQSGDGRGGGGEPAGDGASSDQESADQNQGSESGTPPGRETAGGQNP